MVNFYMWSHQDYKNIEKKEENGEVGRRLMEDYRFRLSEGSEVLTYVSSQNVTMCKSGAMILGFRWGET